MTSQATGNARYLLDPQVFFWVQIPVCMIRLLSSSHRALASELA
jgi:hypothetical protein